MHIPSKEQFQRDQMEVHADMLQTFHNAYKTLSKMTDALVLLNFTKENDIQKFYESLCYFTEGVIGLKEGFEAYAASHEIEVINPMIF